MPVDARKINRIAAESATHTRSVVVEVRALAVTNPAPNSAGMLYEWAVHVSVDPMLVNAERIELADTIAECTREAFAAFAKVQGWE